MIHVEVIQFITENIIHIISISQTLTSDQGSSFIQSQFRDFAKLYKIKFLNLYPYDAQANGETDSINKILIKLIKTEDNPRRWHKVLSEALWAHRISRHDATKVTPYELVYGQEAICLEIC
jgi:transposase